MSDVRVTGHSLDELDTLRDEFDGLVERALDVACSSAVSGLTAALVAGAGDDPTIVRRAWNSQVDETLMPHVVSIFDGATLSVAHQLADGLPLDPADGIPAVPPDASVEYLRQARNRLTNVGDQVWEHVRDQLVAGVQAGESTEQLALRVHAGGQLALPRARTVARTEVNGASNAGAFAEIAFLGLDGTQEWLATSDGRTRPDHANADGQTVPLGGSFTVGGWTLRYPGDPAAPASEIVNCRCTTAYDVADEVPELTCDALASLAAAGQLHFNVGGKQQVDTGHCVVPPVKPAATSASVDKIAALNQGQKAYVYQTFMHPKPISPAYGGAKIHKQLQQTIDMLKSTGKPELQSLGPYDILHVVDTKYVGGKYTFKQKYDEWLASPAGQKVAPQLAVKTVEAVPTPEPMPLTSIDILDAYHETSKPGDVLATATDSANVRYRLAHIHDDETGQSFLGIQVNYGGSDPWSPDQWDTVESITSPSQIDIYALDNNIDEWVSPTKLAAPDVKPDPVPGHVATVVHEAEETAKKVDAVIAENATPVAAPPVQTPVATAAKSVDAPVKTDKGHMPLAQQAGDISAIPLADKEAFYQAYKKTKVTAVWSGNKIWDALQTAKKGFHFTDHEALKILDERFGVHGGSTGYLEKMLKWEQSPAGKKILGEVPAGVQVQPAAGNIAGKLEEIGVKLTPNPAPGPTPTAPKVDIAAIPSSVKKLMVSKLNASGPILSKPPSQVYKKILEIKQWAKGSGYDLTDLDVLRVLDAEKAAQLGVQNKFLFEKKIVEWLKTPSGKATAKKAANEAAGIVKTTAKKATTTAAPAGGGLGDISLSELRANISTTDTNFPDMSVSGAYSLQSQMETAHGAWTTSQRASLRYYTSNNYTMMNKYLRGLTHYATDTVLRHIRNAQAGMRPTTQSFTVYRGTNFSQFGGTHIDQSVVGKVFEDKGFMSTSVGGRAAFGGQVLLQIEVPRGTPAAFVKSISHYSSEDELLLAAGTRYRVQAVSKSGNQTVVRVRVIP